MKSTYFPEAGRAQFLDKEMVCTIAGGKIQVHCRRFPLDEVRQTMHLRFEAPAGDLDLRPHQFNFEAAEKAASTAISEVCRTMDRKIGDARVGRFTVRTLAMCLRTLGNLENFETQVRIVHSTAGHVSIVLKNHAGFRFERIIRDLILLADVPPDVVAGYEYIAMPARTARENAVVLSIVETVRKAAYDGDRYRGTRNAIERLSGKPWPGRIAW